MPATLQRRVRERAADRCEYCRLAQVGQEATFHIDHVQPRHEGGMTTLENLALACVSCSLRKGARTHGSDPTTGALRTSSTRAGLAGKITSKSRTSF
ncbi:HNH endonuclease [Sorangium sp. So ce394]|uniref:HNH endonuclease n=1 Tax=Sorangium sp. So ce394 TaxID=3133310 RepID=UPI003F5B6192